MSAPTFQFCNQVENNLITTETARLTFNNIIQARTQGGAKGATGSLQNFRSLIFLQVFNTKGPIKAIKLSDSKFSRADARTCNKNYFLT